MQGVASGQRCCCRQALPESSRRRRRPHPALRATFSRKGRRATPTTNQNVFPALPLRIILPGDLAGGVYGQPKETFDLRFEAWFREDLRAERGKTGRRGEPQALCHSET